MQELTYSCCGDYFVPNINLPKESRSIGRWGRMHREYIKEHRPILYTQLCLSGELWTYLGANIITRLKRNQYISLDSIEKICNVMDCGVDDILEFTSNAECE